MYWKYGIAVEQIGLTGAEAANYEGVVKMQLSWIDDTNVGKLLFRAIARQALDAPPHQLANFHGAAQPGEPTAECWSGRTPQANATPPRITPASRIRRTLPWGRAGTGYRGSL